MTGAKLLGRAHVHQEGTLSGRESHHSFHIDLRVFSSQQPASDEPRHVDRVFGRAVLRRVRQFHLLQVEDRQDEVALARQEGSVMRDVERHAVVAFAPGDRVPRDDRVPARVDRGEDVLVLQVDVDAARDGVVQRYAGLAVEGERRDDPVLADIDDRDRPVSFRLDAV